MAERSARPATADNVGWNTTPTNPSTDPGGAVRAAGWATNAIPGSDEFNYLQTMWGDFLQWLEDTNPREWTSLAQAIAASGYRDLFRICPPAGGMYSRLQQAFSTAATAATGGNPIQIQCDGEQIYYIAGSVNQSLIAASAVDGSEVWESGALIQFSAVCADGNYVYTMSTNSGETGLYKRNRTDGSAVSSGGTEYYCDHLRTNGVYAIGISPFSSSSKLVFWTVGAGAAAPTETGTQTITPLAGLAIDEDQCYVGGTRNVNDVWAWTLSTRAAAWAVTLDTNAPTVNCLTADGQYVYVGTDSFATAAGPNRSLFCVSRVDGSLIWSLDTGGNVDDICVDDGNIYIMDDSGNLYLCPLCGTSAPTTVLAAVTNVAQCICCDGVAVFCQDGGTATNLRKLLRGGPTRAFMRAAGDDPTRRPFFTLAVPINCHL